MSVTRTDGRGAVLLSVVDTAVTMAEPGLPGLITRLRSAHPIWEIGTANGPPETRWGHVMDVAVDSHGRIHVLDQTHAEVRVFAPDGTWERSFLREGNGPLEIRQPRGIEITSKDSIIVYNTAELRVASTDRDNDSITEARRLVFPSTTFDLCVGRDRLFARVSSTREDGIVEVIDPKGSSLGRFGWMDAHPDPVVRAQLSMGILECGGHEPWVVAASDDGPVVRGYAESGDSLWTAELAEFRQPEIEVLGVDGAVGVQRPGMEPWDRVLALVRLPGEEALVLQVARIGGAVEERGRRIWHVERIDSFLLSATSGQGRFIGDNLPQLMTASATRLVGLKADSNTGVVILAVYTW